MFQEGIEPACGLLVTLRAVKMFMWSSLLGGNILFRWLLQQCPNCWNFQIHLRLLRWSRPGETRKGGTSPCKSALPGKIIKNLPGENLSGKIIHNPFPGKNHWESEQKMLTTPHKGVSQHCFPCILCNFPSAEVLWQVIRKFTDSQCYIFGFSICWLHLSENPKWCWFSLVINTLKVNELSANDTELLKNADVIFKSAIKIKENLPNQESAQSALSGQHVPGENLPSERTRWFPGPRHTPGLLLSYFHWTFGFDFAPSPNLSLMKNLQENVKQRLLTGITSAIFFIYVLGFKFKVELKYL